jgi:hypothetical protein
MCGFIVLLSMKPIHEVVALDIQFPIPAHSSLMLKPDCPIQREVSTVPLEV